MIFNIDVSYLLVMSINLILRAQSKLLFYDTQLLVFEFVILSFNDRN
jgi:hypothetical protein